MGVLDFICVSCSSSVTYHRNVLVQLAITGSLSGSSFSTVAQCDPIQQICHKDNNDKYVFPTDVVACGGVVVQCIKLESLSNILIPIYQNIDMYRF